jgi:hypothetical protein
MVQGFWGNDYRSKRLRLSAFIKTENVEGAAQLYMEIDGETKMVGFDNMDDRPIKGTTDWKNYEIVLDLPTDTVNVNFGFFLVGKGQAWADDFRFEVVGQDVPTTQPILDGSPFREKTTPAPQAKPHNLDFES